MLWPRDGTKTPAGAADEVAREQMARLQAGGPVNLIGETGGPAWSRVVAGAEFANPYLERDGTYAIDTTRVVHVLLMPETGAEAFQLDAEIKQLGGDRTSRFGLSVGREEFQAPGGVAAVQATFQFNETAGDAPGRPAAGRWEAHLSSRVEALKQTQPMELSVGRFPSGPAGPHDWRPLAAVVRSDAIVWTIGGDEVMTVRKPVPPDDVDVLRDVWPWLPASGPSLPAGGGVGLVVQGGNASFRNVRITKLP
jgi:hypothetical protein